MKSFGSFSTAKCSNKLPSHPPQLVNTDYQKRIEQYESALCKALDTVKVLEAEVERKNRMISDLATSTASSIDIETVKKIVKDVSEKELMERKKKIELRELEAQIREQENEEAEIRENIELKQILEEQNHSIAVMQNAVNSFEDVMKKTIKHPEPSYLKPTKLSESRKEEVNNKKKKGK